MKNNVVRWSVARLLNRMMTVAGYSALFGLSLRAAASVIPAERLPSGGWNPGIAGGIPDDYTLFCNVRVSIPGYPELVATGDGITDDTPAINAALNAAPDKTVVFLPAGTYRVNSPIVRAGTYKYDYNQDPFSVILRGEGVTTRLLSYSTTGSIIEIRAGSGWIGQQPILDGNSRGSTAITLESGRGIGVDSWIMIQRQNEQAGVDNSPAYMANAASQLVRVVSIDGNGPVQLGISPPLNEAFGSEKVNWWFSAPYRCGVENLYVERMVPAGMHNIHFIGAQECWVKNVVSVNPNKWNIRLELSGGCEVRQCQVRGAWNGGGDSGYGVGLFRFSCNNLIENNIAESCRHSFIMEYGGQNNVFGYNYSRNPINENQASTDYLMGDICLHGGSPRYNLFEGNVAATIKFDSVLGGSLRNTTFRNRIQRKGLPSTYVACFGSDIQRWNYESSFVGNVYEAAPERYSGGLYRWGTNQDNRDTIDPLSESSAFLHGVVELASGQITWDEALGATEIPVSLYLDKRPEWWGVGGWPSIGLDVAPKAGGNPAFARWHQMNDPGSLPKPVSGLHVTEDE